MKFPASERLGIAKDADGNSYSLHFRGEDEGAAAIVGPVPMNGFNLEVVPEVHTEPAADAIDARAKLDAWCRAKGWTRTD